MKTRTRSALIALLALALIASPAAAGFKFWEDDDTVEGSGKLETRAFDLKDFDRIELEGAMDIDVSFGGDQSVEVTLDDNLFDVLELDVRGRTLTIGWDRSCDPDGDTRMKVVMKKLQAIRIEGAGDIEVHDLKGSAFEYTLHGAGDMDIDGEVDEFEISLNGAGDVDAEDLKARHVKARLNGVGDIEVTATGSIDAAVNGVGEIDYWGRPEKERTRVGGMGEINRR